jgi:NAD+ diphosphatase
MDYWFLFDDGKLLLTRQNKKYEVVRYETVPYAVDGMTHEVGKYQGATCMAAAVADAASVDVVAAGSDADGLVWMGLRESYDWIDVELYKLAGRGSELIFWDMNTRFCPACGTATHVDTVISKKCPHCGKEMFPQLSPAILVMIHKGEQILLVHARTFTRPFHGLVAGFVEPGESLEECVVREVHEETTLDIKNVRYFGSQPWPYPCGIMIGFEADYVSGDIRFADNELTDGRFYSHDELPLIPQKLSLARKLIDSWIETFK